ncbi:MAG: hypothetical protein AABW49_02855 [Nanoarchaeota archaeon]
MPFWIFKKRDELSKHMDGIQTSLKISFKHIKSDIKILTEWIDHFNNKHDKHEEEVEKINLNVLSLNKRIIDIEKVISSLSKQQTAVQTPVRFKQPQTDNRFKQLFEPVQIKQAGDTFTKNMTPMERAIISVLLNTDLKLSYDDLRVAIGRDKSTIRGQVNNIKQKNSKLLKEVAESTGRKRFYIDEPTKNSILKERNSLIINAENKKGA